jgi:hypothetical protein
MIDLCNKMKDSYKKKYDDGIIEVSIRYDVRWYCTDLVSMLNEDINFFNMNDYEEFDTDPEEYEKFRFYFTPIHHKKKVD